MKIRLFRVFTNLLGKYFYTIQLKKGGTERRDLAQNPLKWKSQFKRVKYNRCSIIGTRVQSAHFAGGDLNFTTIESAREIFLNIKGRKYI